MPIQDRLPILVSLPHAGLKVPDEVADLCALSPQEVRADSDEGAREIFGPLEPHVRAFVSTDIARVIVDVNRAEDDFRSTGAVKKRTFQRKRVWRVYPPAEMIDALLQRYWRPYHLRLQQMARLAVLGIDCHTMAALAPPVSPRPGQERPPVCLGNARRSCPAETLRALAGFLGDSLGVHISLNRPFRGGYITRSRPGGIPWVQLELNRSGWANIAGLGHRLIEALVRFFSRYGKLPTPTRSGAEPV